MSTSARISIAALLAATVAGVVGAGITLIAGCAAGPDFVRPAAPIQDRFTPEPLPASTAIADGTAQQFVTGAAVDPKWWQLFRSPQLDSLMERALAANPTVQAAQANLRQSQNELAAGHGVFFPQIGAGSTAERERNAPSLQGLASNSSVFNVFTASGTIGYALDVFGGKRREVESLGAQVDVQRNLSRAAYLTLSANVVNTIIARAAYQAEIHATEHLIDLERRQMHAIQASVDAGTSPYASLLTVRGLIASNEAVLAPLREKLDQAGHLLSILAGSAPADAGIPTIELTALVLPIELPVSLPSDLVRRRPDILSAEAQMHVASANVGVATAAMFPSISLTGNYGAASTKFNALPEAASRFWNVGPTATVPLFQGGTLFYGRRAALEAWRSSQATYRQTVLTAFEQVADLLKGLEHDADGLRAAAESRSAAAEALQLLQAGYTGGITAWLDMVTADIQLQQANITYIQALGQRYQDTVALFVALGGGWTETSPAPAKP